MQYFLNFRALNIYAPFFGAQNEKNKKHRRLKSGKLKKRKE